jgi:hypothetical protein
VLIVPAGDARGLRARARTRVAPHRSRHLAVRNGASGTHHACLYVLLVANSMAVATADVWGAISQLVDAPALLSVEQLGVLSQVLTYVPPTIGGDQSRVTALLLAAMDAKESGRDVEAEYMTVKVMDELEHQVDEVQAGLGRGYSLIGHLVAVATVPSAGYHCATTWLG